MPPSRPFSGALPWAARRPTPTSSPPGSGPCLTPRLGPSETSSFSENLSLKALSNALQRARPEPSAENRQPSRFAAIRPSSPERIFFDDLIFNPLRSASDAPIRPVPPGTRSARSAAPSARHPRPTDPASRRPGRRPRPQRPLTKPRPEPAFHRASPAEISVKSLRTIPQTGSSERMMRVVNMKAFSARQTPLRQEKAAETRQKNRGLP